MGIIYVFFIITLFFIITPLVGLFMALTPQNIGTIIFKQEVVNAFLISIESTTITLLIINTLGIPTAYFLAMKEFRGKEIIDTLIDLPMVLPPAVAGLALLITFGPLGILGKILSHFNINISFTLVSVIIAQVFVAIPYFIKAVRSAIEAIDSNLINISLTLGKGPGTTFLKIILPLCQSAIIRGSVMSWSRALGEFGATMMFAGNMEGVTQTLPLAVYSLLEKDLQASVIVALILVILSFLVMLTVKYLIPGR